MRTSVLNRLSLLVVAFAAALWASDAYFRNQLISHLNPVQIVIGEDALLTLLVLPVLWFKRAEIAQLGRRGWLAVGLIAVGPQALATVLFTASFSYRVFAETFVLQQTQPLLAIALAWFVLGERRRPWFWPGVVAAVAGVYLVVFAPDLTAPFASMERARLEAGALALGAAAMWASGTVLGRVVLARASFTSMTALRFTVALPVLVAIGLVQGGFAEFQHYRVSDFLPNLLAIALIPGLLALMLYYRGLSRTPASLATLAELAYPVAATLIASAPPPWGFSQPLYAPQVVGTVLLLAVLVILNWARDRSVSIETPAPAAALEIATPTP